jgi:hypothetical protein
VTGAIVGRVENTANVRGISRWFCPLFWRTGLLCRRSGLFCPILGILIAVIAVFIKHSTQNAHAMFISYLLNDPF